MALTVTQSISGRTRWLLSPFTVAYSLVRQDAPHVAERIIPQNFAAPVGPWTPAVKVAASGQMLFIAGCISVDANGNVVAPGDVTAQTHQVMQNFEAVVTAAGMSMTDVVKITNYLVDVRDYPAVAKVRQQYLREPYPASSMVQVSGLLYPGLLVEIEGIAIAS
jgi:2-iminobutanoate/2-iminopropanoate deaminase